MTTTRIYILIALLAVSVFCRADSGADSVLSIAEYRAELDSLSSATKELDRAGASTPEALRSVPLRWRVRTDRQEFEISTEGLRRDVRRYEDEKNSANALTIRRRLESLQGEIDGFNKQPADVSDSRKELNSILARSEFRDVRGPTWLDRLKQYILERVLRGLGWLFRSVAIPAISKYLVYGLMGFALLALLYVAYRSFWKIQELEKVVPRDLPVSAKEWAVWLSEARAAAAKGEWRDAIHLAYWAGISYLERQGFWKPDRARTPREYLRMLSSGKTRETLQMLTQTFELAWYAKRGANESAFSQTLEQLEKLGCH